ncbi:MAG: VWA domain-containing protein, partial [Paracoccaceae bacterium]
IGPGRVIDTIRAVEVAGFTERGDFYHVLQACLVSRPEHRRVFAEVFRLFWRDPKYLEHMMSLLIPQVKGVQDDRPAAPAERRAAEALLDGAAPEPPQTDTPPAGDEITMDASATMSAEERLRTLDFELMSTAEMAEAKRMLARLSLPVSPLVTRRFRAASLGAGIDARRTLRAGLRSGGEITSLARKAPV